MNIQWYPGHMTKARRQIEEDLKLIDMVVEIVDARVPLSSRNPDIAELTRNKERVVVLNKQDLADPALTAVWREYFENEGFTAVAADVRNKKDISRIRTKMDERAEQKRQKDLKRGIKNRPLRVMVAGIPNSGKSTFINTFAGKASAKTANRPGVTRGNQWISIGKQILLLDTPGILWPKFEDEMTGVNLSLTGAIRDEIADTGELSVYLIRLLKENYPGAIEKRYDIDETPDEIHVLEEIAKVRSCIKEGGVPDIKRASRLVIDDLRSGSLGRITLEKP